MDTKTSFYYGLGSLFLIGLVAGCSYKTSENYAPKGLKLSKENHIEFFESKPDPENVDWSVRYLKELQKNDWQGSGPEDIQEVILQASKTQEICQLAAEYFVLQKDLENAEIWSERAKDLGANSTDLFKTLSEIHSLSGRHDLAIDYINKAILINRSDAGMYEQKGNIYLQYGDTLSGLEYLKRAYELDSSNVDLSLEIAEVNVRSGKMKQAEDWLLSINETSGNEKRTFLLAKLYYETDRLTESIPLLKTSLEKGNIAAGKYLTDYFKGIDLVDSALLYANQVLEWDSMNISALNTKAACFDSKGYHNSSIQYYELVLSYDSLNEEATLGIEKVKGKIAYLRQLKERREAIPVFDLAVPKKKSNLNNE